MESKEQQVTLIVERQGVCAARAAGEHRMIKQLRIGETHQVKARIQKWRVNFALNEAQVR